MGEKNNKCEKSEKQNEDTEKIVKNRAQKDKEEKKVK